MEGWWVVVVKDQIVSTWKRTLVLVVAVPFNNCHDVHEVNINKGAGVSV